MNLSLKFTGAWPNGMVLPALTWIRVEYRGEELDVTHIAGNVGYIFKIGIR